MHQLVMAVVRSFVGSVLGALLLGAFDVAAGVAQQSASPAAAGAAVVKRGLFTVRHSGERIVFEIPSRALDQDMVMRGPGRDRVVRWRRTSDGIALEEQGGPLRVTMKAERADGDSVTVVDVTSVFTTELLASSGSMMASAKMRIVEVEAFPTNVKLIAHEAAAPAERQAAVIYYNIVQLPKSPMMPRLFDPRVDINEIPAGNGQSDRRYVQRFRLEKRDPSAAVSEVVKPIVFVIDPATPKWLVPHVKAGVAEWLPAFEAAGFRNAIVAREASDSAEDPDWGIDDARYSVLRWDTTNQHGPGASPEVIDPRSGEILRGGVTIPANYIDRMVQRYFIHSGPLDPRIQRYPDVSDEMTGRLTQNLVAHEVGHVLGLPQYDSWSTYPVDSLRSVAFLQRVGRHVPSIMGLQFNYLAQPEDSVPPELLTAVVGPYDHDVITWQMKPIPEARTPEDERPTLASWIKTRDANPWLRFTNRDAMRSASDASAYDDAVRASTLGMRNLDRVMALMRARANWMEENAGRIDALYDAAIHQWRLYQLHVIAMVGGARYPDGFGVSRRAEPLAPERQRAAGKYVREYAFDVPAGFFDPALLRHLEGGEGAAINGFRALQTEVLATLLAPSRLQRLTQQAASAGPRGNPYTARELLETVRRGAWRELDAKQPKIDAYRRNVQLAYVETFERLVTTPDTSSAGVAAAPLLRRELVTLSQQIDRAAPRAEDRATRSHLDDVRQRIRRALDVPRS